MPRQTGEGRVERAIRGKHFGKRNNIVTPQGLVQATLCKKDGKDICNGRKRHKNRKRLRRAFTKHVPEKRSSDNLLAV